MDAWGGMSRVDFFAGERPISAKARRKIEKAVSTRLRRVPLAYIIGSADFLGESFHVSRDVLIPRPETEILVEETLKIAQNFHNPLKILEIGTGSGCIAIGLTKRLPDCRMTALDVSPKALRMARKNARVHGVAGRIRFLRSDLFPKGRRWDVIVSNPPYIPTGEIAKLEREVRREPCLALDGGRQGLEIIRKILDESPAHLEKDGFLLMEIGHDQSLLIGKIISQDRRWTEHRFIKDFAGIERILIARHG